MANASMNELSAATCAQVFARLADYLDGELSAEEMRLVEHHLELCEVCASEYRFEESVLSVLKQRARSDAVPETLRQRVTSMLDRMATGGPAVE